MAATPPKPPVASPPLLVTEREPRSPAAEAYRMIGISIAFAGLDAPCKSIVITSASPKEGKSTTVANFGVVSAQEGKRVCLIDSDLRRPVLHRMFRLANGQGFTTALAEGASFAEVVQPTRVPNLSVVTSGPLPTNPGALVSSKRMRRLQEEAAADFDLLLWDTPPLIIVSDGLALTAQCDGVLLVIRASAIPYDVARRVTNQITGMKGRILGVILNRVGLGEHYYYDYYRHYGGYYRQEKAVTRPLRS